LRLADPAKADDGRLCEAACVCEPVFEVRQERTTPDEARISLKWDAPSGEPGHCSTLQHSLAATIRSDILTGSMLPVRAIAIIPLDVSG
jgi:hypothetical protein